MKTVLVYHKCKRELYHFQYLPYKLFFILGQSVFMEDHHKNDN